MSFSSYLDAVLTLEGGADTHVLDFMAQSLPRVQDGLAERGAVLLRGFRAPESDLVERSLALVGRELLDDAFWSTPRSGVSEKTFTATEYPRQRTIALHSEMAYMTAWPRLLAFHALEVAEEGGETTIAPLDPVSRELDELLLAFQERGVLYRRTYHAGVDVPWQKAFRTNERSEVEAVAARTGMTLAWLEGDVLQSTHKAQGTVRSESGVPLWFSQAHVFHPSNLPPAQLDAMVQLFGRERLPRNALYGDGEEIPAAVIRRVNEAFNRHALKVAWRPGDLLLLDNMRFAHGRMPFKGSRRLHVAMANQQTTPRRTPVFEPA